MPDGTQRAVQLYVFEDEDSEVLEDTLAFGNTIVIMQGDESQSRPSVIHAVLDIGDNNSSLWLSTPPDTEGPVMRCELIYNIESRSYGQFNENQKSIIINRMILNHCAHSQYLIIASQHHQHQLGMLIDNITSDYYPGVDKRLFWHKFKKESPVDLAVHETLTRLGLAGDMLLQLSSANAIYYYVILDAVPGLIARLFPAVFSSLAPWYVASHRAGFVDIEQLYNHPNNHHAKEAIREVMKLMKRSRSYGLTTEKW